MTTEQSGPFDTPEEMFEALDEMVSGNPEVSQRNLPTPTVTNPSDPVEGDPPALDPARPSGIAAVDNTILAAKVRKLAASVAAEQTALGMPTEVLMIPAEMLDAVLSGAPVETPEIVAEPDQIETELAGAEEKHEFPNFDSLSVLPSPSPEGSTDGEQ